MDDHENADDPEGEPPLVAARRRDARHDGGVRLCPPPWRADVLGVEIGASVAHAEEVTDVTTWENARKSYGSNQTVKVMNGDTELAAFTTNGYVTLSYTPSSGDGTNETIAVKTNQKGFKDVTIYANTTLL